MIYLGTNKQDAKNYPMLRRRTDHIVTLSNIEADVRKNRMHYSAATVDAVTKLLAKSVSTIRKDINTGKRRDRRVGDRRGS